MVGISPLAPQDCGLWTIFLPLIYCTVFIVEKYRNNGAAHSHRQSKFSKTWRLIMRSIVGKGHKILLGTVTRIMRILCANILGPEVLVSHWFWFHKLQVGSHFRREKLGIWCHWDSSSTPHRSKNIQVTRDEADTPKKTDALVERCLLLPSIREKGIEQVRYAGMILLQPEMIKK